MYESVIEIQKMLGSDLKGNDYLFMNPGSKERKYYTREVFARRLKKCLKDSGLQDKIDMDGRKINLYSARHAWFSWRLRYGSVPLQLLAKAGGNSVPVIMKTYGHIQIEKEALKLMKGQARVQIPRVDKEVTISSSEKDKNRLELLKKKLEDPNLNPSERNTIEKMLLLYQSSPEERKITVGDNEDES